MNFTHANRASIEGHCFAVEFRRHDDRYGHAIVLKLPPRIPGESQVRLPMFDAMLSAGEALANADAADGALWPPSPILQELHIEEREAGCVALLVGRGGKSHWSASFEFDRGGALVVDTACRIHAPAPWLGSTYGILSPIETFMSSPETDALHEADSSTSELRFDLALSPRLTLEISAFGTSLGDSSSAASTQLRYFTQDQRPNIRRLEMRPQAEANVSSFPRTVRWRYRFAVAASFSHGFPPGFAAMPSQRPRGVV
jgi:hypothetical protein